MDAKIVNKESS